MEQVCQPQTILSSGQASSQLPWSVASSVVVPFPSAAPAPTLVHTQVSAASSRASSPTYTPLESEDERETETSVPTPGVRLAVGPLTNRDDHMAWSANLPHPAALEETTPHPDLTHAVRTLTSWGKQAESQLNQRLAEFAGRAARLQPSSDRIRVGLQTDVVAVNPSIHYALIQDEVEKLWHKDTALPEMVKGCTIFSTTTDTQGTFPPRKKFVHADLSADVVLKSREAWEKDPPATSKKHRHQLYQKSLEATTLNRALGPFRAAEAPHPQFASSLRFMVVAEGKKPRECDDARRSGVNATSSLTETTPMPGFAGLLLVLLVVMRYFPELPLMISTEDFSHAFGQLPLHPGQRKFSYFHVGDDAGHPTFFCHTAGWFGPRLMPHAWARVTALVLKILRVRFAIPCDCHVDDIFVIVPSLSANLAPLMHAIVRKVVEWLGFHLSASKSRLPARTTQALGGQITLPRSGELTAQAELAPNKKEVYIQRLRLWAARDVLPSELAAKVAGYAQVLVSVLFGRLARAYLWPVYQRANGFDNSSTNTPCLRFCLKSLARLIEVSRPKLVRPLLFRPLFRIYGDARGSPEHMGALCIAPSGEVTYWSSTVSPEWAALLDPCTPDNRIFQLELLWMPICIASFGKYMKDVDVVIYNDNEGAVRSTRKGYSGNPFAAAIVAEFWILVCSYGWHVWIEAVASEANPADPLSRPGTQEADGYAELRSWVEVLPIFPALEGFRAHLVGHPLAGCIPMVSSRTCVELFSGKRAPLTGAWTSCGLPCSQTEDATSSGTDLTLPRVKAIFLEKTRLRYFVYVHLGTPCSTWVPLYRRHPSMNTRTLTNLWGDGMSRAEVAGNKTVKFSLAMIQEQISAKGWVSLETPLGSWILELRQIKEWIEKGLLFLVHCCACTYLPAGMKYKKPTVLVTNAPWLRSLASECTCVSHDVSLMDMHNGSRLASLAGEYPPLLCSKWAELLSVACK